MEFKRFLGYFLLMIFTLLGCSSEQEKNIKELQDIVQIGERTYEKASDNDWEALELRFNVVNSNFKQQESEYSNEQKDTMNILVGRFRAFQTKRIAKNVEERLKDLGKKELEKLIPVQGEQAEGFVKEILK